MNPVQELSVAEHYRVTCSVDADDVALLEMSFGTPAQNDKIVPDAVAAVAALRLKGGKGVKFNGAASLPVAMALAHAVAHLYGWVACFDPKLGRYVVVISHDPGFKPCDLLV
jgi:CRISPR-associated protein Csx3